VMSSPALPVFSPPLQPCDQLSSSPHLKPKLFQTTSSTHPPHHPCSIPACTKSTTSPPLSAPFLRLATLCFPPTAQGDADFYNKVAVFLCSYHRNRLEEYRKLAVGHAEHIIDVWNDMNDQHHDTHKHQQLTQTQVMEDKHDQHQTLHSSTAPLLPAVSGNYRTFTSSLSAASTSLMSSAADGSLLKRPLSCASRAALAGGWLLVASFVSLWAAYSIVHWARA